MAATAQDAQDLINNGRCNYCTIPLGLVNYAILAALIDLNNGVAVSTDPQVLIGEAKCLECVIPPGFVGYAILQALNNLSTGGIGGGVDCGAGPPVAAPTSTCALYIDTNNGTLYSYYSGSWH